jgi:hypothetical protein
MNSLPRHQDPLTHRGYHPKHPLITPLGRGRLPAVDQAALESGAL